MTSPLLTLSDQEWEDLCDGCGRCCLVKLEDIDSGALYYTNVACQFLDQATCRCSDYPNRARLNPRCMVLGPNKLDLLNLMPDTCAYRLRHARQQPHANPEQLKVSGKVISEEFVHEDQLEQHVIDWISTGWS